MTMDDMQRQRVTDVEQLLRDRVLGGEYPDGSVLPQARIAKELGISRTPVREAMRALQSEGLLIGEPNRRMRVATCTLGELEDVYATRIMLESLAVALSIPHMDEAHFDLLDESLGRIADEETCGEFDRWAIEHHRFHMQLVAFCGTSLYERIERLHAKSLRFQRLYNLTQSPRWWMRRSATHTQLVAACKAQRPSWAARLTAQHLGQTAITLANDQFRDEPQSGALEAAIEMVTAGSGALNGLLSAGEQETL
ncbi:MAG: GntR family transcriptional regulator [Roseitalea sp.]|jgi:DNA-binding GntR family transcriptional regulator|nr:GntR family transcriptional regulator [Roseitalea sp.]MBO6720454.1 GntR family transcriptional regulator [Roseitalea sp.]MBO6742814.1 GntR family transcriptional regulator [Roseitalea sp.]